METDRGPRGCFLTEHPAWPRCTTTEIAPVPGEKWISLPAWDNLHGRQSNVTQFGNPPRASRLCPPLAPASTSRNTVFDTPVLYQDTSNRLADHERLCETTFAQKLGRPVMGLDGPELLRACLPQSPAPVQDP
jgi:hypothetical protein